jgi:hypothetical protein
VHQASACYGGLYGQIARPDLVACAGGGDIGFPPRRPRCMRRC